MTEAPAVETPPEVGGSEAEPIDYFGFSERHKHYLPDGKQYVEFEAMNEGARKRFQQKTNRDLVLERQSGNARMKVDPATERHILITESVKDWHIMRKGAMVPFAKRNLEDFLELAPPSIIDGIEKAIRKANPWLLGEMSVADIDKEIENLQEMREVAAKREAGESS